MEKEKKSLAPFPREREKEDVELFHSRCTPSTTEIVLAAENTSCDWASPGRDKDMVKERRRE